MQTLNLELLDKNSVCKLAQNLAKIINNNDVILLKGDLGSGKTYFAKHFINSFYDHKKNVNSPSFNIVQTYKTKLFTIWHFDLYRLKSKQEIFNIGIEEAFNEGVSLIEWPEIVEDMLPKDFIEINLDFTSNSSKRLVSLKLNGKWQKLILFNRDIL